MPLRLMSAPKPGAYDVNLGQMYSNIESPALLFVPALVAAPVNVENYLATQVHTAYS
jgi:hypothetical protein